MRAGIRLRGSMSKSDGKRIVVGVNALIIDGATHRLFCIKRADTDSFFSGMYALPGGGINKGEQISEAIKREFLEETGYLFEHPTDVKLEATVDLGKIVLQVLVVEGTLGDKVTDKVDSDIAEVGWVSFDLFFRSLREHHYPESEIQKFRLYLRNKLQK